MYRAPTTIFNIPELNMNYAKSFPASLSPPKPTPTYNYDQTMGATKHMSSYVSAMVPRTRRNVEKYGCGSQAHHKLVLDHWY